MGASGEAGSVGRSIGLLMHEGQCPLGLSVMGRCGRIGINSWCRLARAATRTESGRQYHRTGLPPWVLARLHGERCLLSTGGKPANRQAVHPLQIQDNRSGARAGSERGASEDRSHPDRQSARLAITLRQAAPRADFDRPGAPCRRLHVGVGSVYSRLALSTDSVSLQTLQLPVQST